MKNDINAFVSDFSSYISNENSVLDLQYQVDIFLALMAEERETFVSKTKKLYPNIKETEIRKALYDSIFELLTTYVLQYYEPKKDNATTEMLKLYGFTIE